MRYVRAVSASAGNTRHLVLGLLFIATVLGGCGSSHGQASTKPLSAADAAKLSGRWWNWAIPGPSSTSPLEDRTGAACARNQPSDVWFLAGTFGGAVRRECTVPSDRRLFFPVVNSFGTAEDCAAFMRAPGGSATLDGKALALIRINGAQFDLSAGEGNVVGLDPGDYRGTVSCGLYASVATLSPGTHQLKFGGADGRGFHAGVTYSLTVR